MPVDVQVTPGWWSPRWWQQLGSSILSLPTHSSFTHSPTQSLGLHATLVAELIIASLGPKSQIPMCCYWPRPEARWRLLLLVFALPAERAHGITEESSECYGHPRVSEWSHHQHHVPLSILGWIEQPNTCREYFHWSWSSATSPASSTPLLEAMLQQHCFIATTTTTTITTTNISNTIVFIGWKIWLLLMLILSFFFPPWRTKSVILFFRFFGSKL